MIGPYTKIEVLLIAANFLFIPVGGLILADLVTAIGMASMAAVLILFIKNHDPWGGYQ